MDSEVFGGQGLQSNRSMIVDPLKLGPLFRDILSPFIGRSSEQAHRNALPRPCGDFCFDLRLNSIATSITTFIVTSVVASKSGSRAPRNRPKSHPSDSLRYQVRAVVPLLSLLGSSARLVGRNPKAKLPNPWSTSRPGLTPFTRRTQTGVLVARLPPMRFRPLQRIPTQSSGILWLGLPRLTACAFRFSQPRDAFIRPESVGPISCRIRSWGFPFRAFFHPRSRTVLSTAYPLMTFRPTKSRLTTRILCRRPPEGGASADKRHM